MAQQQDEVFIDEIRRVKQTAFGVAYLILKNTSDCEDAMSAAIENTLQQQSRFRAWFLQILRNEAYAILRQRRRFFVTSEMPEGPSSAETDPSRSLDLRAALMQLSESKRNALYLWQEGYSMEEISMILNAPAGTVKSRIARAKEALRQYLEVD